LWAQTVAQPFGLKSVEKIHGCADRIANKARGQQKEQVKPKGCCSQVFENVLDSVVVSVEAESI